jgi:GGDEF domain-containing protein
MTVAERVCVLLESSFELLGSAIQLRGSVGVACSKPAEVTSSEELVRRADAAMYLSKGQRAGPVLAPSAG